MPADGESSCESVKSTGEAVLRGASAAQGRQSSRRCVLNPNCAAAGSSRNCPGASSDAIAAPSLDFRLNPGHRDGAELHPPGEPTL